jgi:hypothetical protein
MRIEDILDAMKAFAAIVTAAVRVAEYIRNTKNDRRTSSERQRSFSLNTEDNRHR